MEAFNYLSGCCDMSTLSTCGIKRTATLAQTLAALLTLAWHRQQFVLSQCQQGSQCLEGASEVFQDVVPSEAEALSRHKVFEHFRNSCHAIWTCCKEQTATLAQILCWHCLVVRKDIPQRRWWWRMRRNVINMDNWLILSLIDELVARTVTSHEMSSPPS